ncbi:MAG: DUF3084 domain-containing protein [Abditibacteriota bacterium]|nr:DUF3084 domain-containing protein [Abditibacteriota bacterium]
MLYSVFVFILLVLLSGGIAFLGDYIGRYLGKKRLTAFGLRPKHTAIISTIITGMLISFVALLVLTGINREFRDVVFHGKQIMENNKKLEQESEKLLANNKELISSNNELKNEQKELKEKSLSLENIAKSLEDKNIKLNIKARNSEKTANALGIRAKSLEKNISKLLSDYNRSKKTLEDAQKAKKVAETNISALKESIARQQKELEEITNKSNGLSEQLADKQKALDDSEKKLVSQEKNLSDIEDQLSIARANLEETLKALDVANQELETYSQLRLSDVIVKQDDEIIRSVIEGNDSLINIKENLYKFVALGAIRCNRLTKKLTGKENGMILAYKSETGEILMVDEKRLIDQAADLIKESKNNRTLVILSSAGNFTANDLNKGPIVAELKLLEDKLLYKKGARVTKKYFDGKQNESYVFSDVYTFVTNDLHQLMGKQGMVLKQQSLLDDNTNVTSKIEVQLDLTRRINDTDSMCLVTVTAKDNIYSHDIYSSDLFEYEVEIVK